MKKGTIMIIFFLLILISLHGVTYKREYIERLTKETILQQARLDSLKAEIRFEGNINTNSDNKISWFNGNFQDIEVPAHQDSIAMKEIFQQVIARIKPHFVVNNEPLLQEKVQTGTNYCSIIYYQIINGVRFEGTILYNFSQKYFNISSLSQIPFERTEEYAKNKVILDARVERFKAETGFEGRIGKHYRSMSFGNLFGNFRDIEVTAKKDTTIMRQVFEQVRTKIMPYVRAEEGQLFAEKVITDITMTRIMYYQKINGYPVYRAGRLVIDYNFSTSEFVITDNTIEKSSEYVPINITEDEAINIVWEQYGYLNKHNKNDWFSSGTRSRLLYAPVKNESGMTEFILCYVISTEIGLYHVHPITGKIIYIDIMEPFNTKN